ncbi:MAG: TatD family hydrolase [Proteobacteria bacterium]|nr:TatD family hydrolase [Pseudomonadota bacterium]
MELWDTHCHLTLPPLSGDVDGALARAREASVAHVVVPAYDVASFADVAALADRPGVRTAIGLHPWAAGAALSRAELEAALDAGRAAAVGEIGLDFKVEGADRPRQIAALELQLDVAVARDLPVLLHCRGAFEELAAALAPLRGRVRGVLHAFSRGPDLARRFLDLGLMLAFGGAITRPSAGSARKSAAFAPADRVLLETDAPSIGIDGVPPEETEPRHVREIAFALAAVRGVGLAEIAAATSENARLMFG